MYEITTKILMDSGVFKDEKSLADAICVYGVVKRGRYLPVDGEVTRESFPIYLVKKCNVKPEDTGIAIKLIETEDPKELCRLSKRVALAKQIG
jgi:hypothetical protein